MKEVGILGRNIELSDCFLLMNVSCIILIDDVLKIRESRTAFFYDFVRVSPEERQRIIDSFEDEDLKTSLTVVSEDIKACTFDYTEIPVQDIEIYLMTHPGYESLMDHIKKVDAEKLQSESDVALRFGMGILGGVKGYEDIIKYSVVNGERISLRIYNDFLEEDVIHLRDDIAKFGINENQIVCVVDDQLNRNNRAAEIIETLANDETAQQHIVCLILSSADKSDLSRYDETLYTDFIRKDEDQLNKKIRNAFMRSHYSVILRRLEKLRIDSIQQSYKYVLSNPQIARHLAAMAEDEDETNYNILFDWLELRDSFYWHQNNRAEVQQLVAASTLLSELDEETPPSQEMSDAAALRTFNNFDYTVNELHLPPMVGDIFLIKDSYYLLVGQECDYTVRNGNRKAFISELVPLKLVQIRLEGNSEKPGYEKVMLSDFVDSTGTRGTLSINCTKRVLLNSEMLDLTAFNHDGQAKINFTSKELPNNIKWMLSNEWLEYYKIIREKLHILQLAKTKINAETTGFEFADLLDAIDNTHTQSILPMDEFSQNNGQISYELKRICRVKRHMLLINKLYHEYRGRQAFNTVNMDVQQPDKCILKYQGNESSPLDIMIIMTNKRRENQGNKLKQRDWIMKKDSLINGLKTIGVQVDATEQDDIPSDVILVGVTGNIPKTRIGFQKIVKEDLLTLQVI